MLVTIFPYDNISKLYIADISKITGLSCRMWVQADNFQLNFGVCQTIGGTRKRIHIFIPSMHVCLSKSEDAPCILSIVEASVMIAN